MNRGSGNTAAQHNLVPGLCWVVRHQTSDLLIYAKQVQHKSEAFISAGRDIEFAFKLDPPKLITGFMVSRLRSLLTWGIARTFPSLSAMPNMLLPLQGDLLAVKESALQHWHAADLAPVSRGKQARYVLVCPAASQGAAWLTCKVLPCSSPHTPYTTLACNPSVVKYVLKRLCCRTWQTLTRPATWGR